MLSKLCGEGGSGVTRPPSPEVSPPSFALQPMVQDEQVDLLHVVWALFKLLFSLLDLMEIERDYMQAHNEENLFFSVALWGPQISGLLFLQARYPGYRSQTPECLMGGHLPLLLPREAPSW